MSENLQATKKLTSAAKERDSLQAQLKASQTKNEQIFKLNSENTTITTQLKANQDTLQLHQKVPAHFCQSVNKLTTCELGGAVSGHD